MANYILLDVRTPEEFADVHVKTAQNIDFLAPNFAERVATLDRSNAYKLYCRSGNRSGRALALMETMGFTQLENLGTVEQAGAALKLDFERS